MKVIEAIDKEPIDVIREKQYQIKMYSKFKDFRDQYYNKDHL